MTINIRKEFLANESFISFSLLPIEDVEVLFKDLRATSGSRPDVTLPEKDFISAIVELRKWYDEVQGRYKVERGGGSAFTFQFKDVMTPNGFEIVANIAGLGIRIEYNKPAKEVKVYARTGFDFSWADLDLLFGVYEKAVTAIQAA